MNKVLFICYLLFLASCQNQGSTQYLVDKLVTKEIVDTVPSFYRFKQIGKDAIPALISVIDNNERGYIGFLESSSSSLTRLNDGFVGIRAAYMIEYILADTNQIELYKYAVIVNNENNRPYNFTPLTLSDMKEIKRSYNDWWRKNKQKSFNELKNDWRKNKRVLDGSKYIWI